jgi:DNA-binding NarL/FixJ family response regulator
MKVFIFDRNWAIAEHLAQLIKESIPTSHIVYYTTGKETFSNTFQFEGNIIVLDSLFSVDQQFNFIQSIKSANIATKVVCMYTQIDNSLMEEYKIIGVDYFLDKYFEFEQLPLLIQAITKS